MATVQNALWRRDEQIRRWKLSDTNNEPSSPKEKKKSLVKFQESCVFLAACSSCDKEEISKLLEKGANINTANIDGLTALHQACIDDNLDMVTFLINNGADIDAGDNEGWTALHATASCGFLEIAKFLVKSGANIAAVNNDGELASDLAEGEDMECLLADEMKAQGIDADAARNEEENQMMRDANQWLNDKFEDTPHEKTGATALHVAAAKGYLKVITLLLQAGADINAKDFDGWTPLHAAAHWGQDESCKILVENHCDMDITNSSGQTALDLADSEVVPLLEELKKSQASMKESSYVSNTIIDTSSDHKSQSSKRRSSVTRMSGDQKHHMVSKSVEDERSKLKELKKVDEEEKEDVKVVQEGESQPEKDHDTTSSDVDNEDIYDEEASSESDSDKQTDSKPAKNNSKEVVTANVSAKESDVSEPNKAPSTSQPVTVTITGDEVSQKNDSTVNHSGLRKTGSASAVPDQKSDLDKLARSASSSWIEKKEIKEDSSSSRPRRILSYSGVGEHSSDANKNKEDLFARYTSLLNKSSITPSTAITTIGSSSTLPSSGLTQSHTKSFTGDRDRKAFSQTYPAPSTGSITSPTGTARKTYEPPKRDEEKEVERKARAKRARETRRSTQGVTKDDIVKAEEALKMANQVDDKKNVVERSSLVKKDQNNDNSADDRSDKENNKPENYTTQTHSTQLSYKIDNNHNKGESTDSNERQSIESNDPALLSVPDSSVLKKDDPSQKSQAIRTRRKRESRRPTGKITLEDLQGVSNDAKETNEDKNDGKDDVPSTKVTSSSVSITVPSIKAVGSRYSEPVVPGNTLQSLSDNAGRHSYSGSARIRPSSITGTLTSEKSVVDYSKLYEQEKSENEKLRKEMDALKQELTQTKLNLDRAKQKTEAKTNESREKRALERKIAKLEEEVKSVENLKADNQRLKEENGALIRVISKLSK